MTTSVGRIVHFLAVEQSMFPDEDGIVVPYPAVILKVHSDEVVNLLVHGPHNDERRTSVRLGREGEPNTWVWPPRG